MQSQPILPAELDGLTQDSAHKVALLEVLRVVEEMTDDHARAVRFVLEEPIRIFSGQTAAELVVSGRAKDVLGYLESLSAGAAG